MDSQLSETIAILIIWILREIVGNITSNKQLSKIVSENSKHIEENKALLAKIKNRIR